MPVKYKDYQQKSQYTPASIRLIGKLFNLLFFLISLPLVVVKKWFN